MQLNSDALSSTLGYVLWSTGCGNHRYYWCALAAAFTMTPPYIYDESSTFQYEESSSFQYTDSFQPFDTGYNEYQPIGSAWPSTNEHIASTMPPFYEEGSFQIQQAHLPSTPSQAPNPQQDLNPVSIGPYGPMYGHPITFEAPRILPYYPKSPLQQVQPLGYSPVSDTNTVTSLTPKRPVVALEWRKNDSVTPMKEGPNLAKKRKTINIAPASERDSQDVKAAASSNPQQALTTRSLEDCMGLFDTTLTATKEKRRRKVFSAQEKKVVKSVRNVGACIQCKFRKKTVSPNCSCLNCRTNHPCVIVQCRPPLPILCSPYRKYYLGNTALSA
jgi:hypothetical protein